jgi:2-succinyl-6-hydroxy-2,4-cyclohexadiene-1-carboxylate synthase
MTRPMILLHGFTGSSESWFSVRAGLDRATEVVAFELPGHGLNPDQGSVEAFADRLASELAGRRANVLGYSLGARVALRVAVSHPEVVDRLILESPSAGIADPAERKARRRADEQLADRIERDGIDAFVDEWERSPVFAGHAALEPDVAARQRAIRLAQDPHGLAQSLRLAGQGAMGPLHDRLVEVRAPTLVIAGALDPTRPRAEQVAAGIPGARLAIVDGAGHTPHLERPGAFLALVLDFIEEVPPA